MQEALGAGASLSRLVIEANEPAAGSVWTFAPDGFEMASLKRFTHSIDWRGDKGRSTTICSAACTNACGDPELG